MQTLFENGKLYLRVYPYYYVYGHSLSMCSIDSTFELLDGRAQRLDDCITGTYILSDDTIKLHFLLPDKYAYWKIKYSFKFEDVEHFNEYSLMVSHITVLFNKNPLYYARTNDLENYPLTFYTQFTYVNCDIKAERVKRKIIENKEYEKYEKEEV